MSVVVVGYGFREFLFGRHVDFSSRDVATEVITGSVSTPHTLHPPLGERGGERGDIL